MNKTVDAGLNGQFEFISVRVFEVLDFEQQRLSNNEGEAR